MMKKNILCALFVALSGTTIGQEAPKDTQAVNIVKVIDFTGTRDKAEIAKNLPHAEIEQYLINPNIYEVKKPEPVVETPAPKVVNQQTINQNRTIKKAYTYTVKGQKYQTLAHSKGFEQFGEASWYGPGFHGKKTANGEIYDMHDMTAAHKELPLGTTVEVTNAQNGKKVVVRINDRGPFHGNRVLDLSKAAAEALGVLNHGVAEVHIRALH